MTRADALRIAREWLAAGWRERGPLYPDVLDAPRGPVRREDREPVILEDQVVEESFGWVLPYQTRLFVRTGDSRDGLAGNWPLVVDRRGNLYVAAPASADERDWRDPLRPFRSGAFPAPVKRRGETE